MSNTEFNERKKENIHVEEPGRIERKSNLGNLGKVGGVLNDDGDGRSISACSCKGRELPCACSKHCFRFELGIVFY